MAGKPSKGKQSLKRKASSGKSAVKRKDPDELEDPFSAAASGVYKEKGKQKRRKKETGGQSNPKLPNGNLTTFFGKLDDLPSTPDTSATETAVPELTLSPELSETTKLTPITPSDEHAASVETKSKPKSTATGIRKFFSPLSDLPLTPNANTSEPDVDTPELTLSAESSASTSLTPTTLSDEHIASRETADPSPLDDPVVQALLRGELPTSPVKEEPDLPDVDYDYGPTDIVDLEITRSYSEVDPTTRFTQEVRRILRELVVNCHDVQGLEPLGLVGSVWNPIQLFAFKAFNPSYLLEKMLLGMLPETRRIFSRPQLTVQDLKELRDWKPNCGRRRAVYLVFGTRSSNELAMYIGSTKNAQSRRADHLRGIQDKTTPNRQKAHVFLSHGWTVHFKLLALWQQPVHSTVSLTLEQIMMLMCGCFDWSSDHLFSSIEASHLAEFSYTPGFIMPKPKGLNRRFPLNSTAGMSSFKRPKSTECAHCGRIGSRVWYPAIPGRPFEEVHCTACHSYRLKHPDNPVRPMELEESRKAMAEWKEANGLVGGGQCESCGALCKVLFLHMPTGKRLCPPEVKRFEETGELNPHERKYRILSRSLPDRPSDGKCQVCGNWMETEDLWFCPEIEKWVCEYDHSSFKLFGESGHTQRIVRLGPDRYCESCGYEFTFYSRLDGSMAPIRLYIAKFDKWVCQQEADYFKRAGTLCPEGLPTPQPPKNTPPATHCQACNVELWVGKTREAGDNKLIRRYWCREFRMWVCKRCSRSLTRSDRVTPKEERLEQIQRRVR